MLAIFNLGGGEIFVLLAMLVVIIPLALLSFVFWLWMLIDCIKNESLVGNEKMAWVVVIVLTHWLGALIYFFAGRSKNKAVRPAPPHASI